MNLSLVNPEQSLPVAGPVQPAGPTQGVIDPMYAAILAGGVGTRLWPRSRQSHPKQFADITGSGRTMLQATADRLQGLVEAQHLFVVTGQQYAQLTTEQLPDLCTEHVILEPTGRNTAPAIGLACMAISRRQSDAVVAILPADHVITDTDAFQSALQHAQVAATAGHIVTLGILPTFPHTGYGYIKRGESIFPPQESEQPVYAVEQFLEKPNRATAEAFLAEGGYYWNGGIFVCRVDVMLDEIRRQLPTLAAGLDAIRTAWDESPAAAAETLAATWPTMPSISIDHGVMEGARSVATVPLDAGWNDVGSWDALETVLEQDASRNYVVQGDLISVDASDNIVYCDKRLVALIGVENLVVVDTGDTLLIGHKQQMQKVKDLVERLHDEGRSDLL